MPRRGKPLFSVSFLCAEQPLSAARASGRPDPRPFIKPLPVSANRFRTAIFRAFSLSFVCYSSGADRSGPSVLPLEHALCAAGITAKAHDDGFKRQPAGRQQASDSEEISAFFLGAKIHILSQQYNRQYHPLFFPLFHCPVVRRHIDTRIAGFRPDDNSRLFRFACGR